MKRDGFPELAEPLFLERLAGVSPAPMPEAAGHALFLHYDELRRWNRTLSLIGPGTLDQVLERHFAESMAALPLLADLAPASQIVDVGSGAGFPGLVLAALLPQARVTLVEARERKWAFLSAVARRAALPCHCLNARVRRPLPEGVPASIDVLTARAIRLEGEPLEELLGRCSPAARLLLWVGREDPAMPAPWRVARRAHLAGSAERSIVEFVRG